MKTQSHTFESTDPLTILCSFLLVRHPHVLGCLQDEITSVIGKDANITRAHIQKMGYLRCILNESMYMRFDYLCSLTYNTDVEQHYDCTLRFHSMFALLRTLRGYHEVVDPMVILPCLFAKERVSDLYHTTCIEGRMFMEKTRWNSGPSDGRVPNLTTLGGHTCRFMGVQDYASEVS